MCSINRLSIYLLLVIMINLSLLTYSLVSVIFRIRRNTSTSKTLLNLLSTFVPLILIVVGYALDGTTESVFVLS